MSLRASGGILAALVVAPGPKNVVWDMRKPRAVSGVLHRARAESQFFSEPQGNCQAKILRHDTGGGFLVLKAIRKRGSVRNAAARDGNGSMVRS